MTLNVGVYPIAWRGGVPWRRGSLPVLVTPNARPAASVAFAPTTPDEASVSVALAPPMFSRILTAWTLPPLSRGMLRRVVMFSPVV